MNRKARKKFISDNERVVTSILDKSPGCLNCISFLTGPRITTEENQQTVSPPFWFVCPPFHSISESIHLTKFIKFNSRGGLMVTALDSQARDIVLCAWARHFTLSPCFSPPLHIGCAPNERHYCDYRLIIDWSIPSVSTDIDLSPSRTSSW